MSPFTKARFGTWLAVLTLAFSIMLFCLAGVYTLRQQEHVDRSLCEGTVENRQAVRDTWNSARFFITRDQTEEAKVRTNEFFDAVLQPIPPLECVDNKPVPKEG